MPGRDVSPRILERERPRSRRVLASVLAALALLAIGIAIGSRIASSQESAPPAADVASAPSTDDRSSADRATSTPPTRAGAVAAAALSITAFDGDVLLEPIRLRAVVGRIASAESRARLLEAFEQASAQTRAKLGTGSVPRPVIVLRSVPVGYRVESFARNRATIAVWYVGIVGSGATVEPQQSWRTQIVSLVWEDWEWRVSSFESSAGPTPPLSTAEIAQSPGELFAALPRFEEFQRVEP
ncbi:MAG: hypothetical protein WKF41_13215 [Gaiellaceae bacterium]